MGPQVSGKVLSDAACAIVGDQPPPERGPGFQTVPHTAWWESASWESEQEYVGFACWNDLGEIPEYMNSPQFLVFAGFDDAATQKIWDSWSGAVDEPLYHHAIAFIRERAKEVNASEYSHDWDATWRNMGASGRLCSRLVNYQWFIIRKCQTAQAQMVGNVRDAYGFLERLSRVIIERRDEQLAHISLSTPRN
ncbi:hypothetical protein NLG97_g6654 [Lecanicillium saksenae]|uniref:Uncharacterized protein n=1 Tax=Lecanicillium saksenae TaxID=468837 RepID=A0ACC1QP11_9HYPO|nr:hypothetical protein NLG97_g6654 [Lecanicillium saksenae]